MSSFPITTLPWDASGNSLKMSKTVWVALKIPAILSNRRLDIKPRLTTSWALICFGIVITCEASISTIRPEESSAITGKKFNNSPIFSFLSLVVPCPLAVAIDKSLANLS